jgi:hypothetical protein
MLCQFISSRSCSINAVSSWPDNLALSWIFPYTKPLSIALHQELLPGRFEFDGNVLAITLPLDLANALSLLKTAVFICRLASNANKHSMRCART